MAEIKDLSNLISLPEWYGLIKKGRTINSSYKIRDEDGYLMIDHIATGMKYRVKVGKGVSLNILKTKPKFIPLMKYFESLGLVETYSERVKKAGYSWMPGYYVSWDNPAPGSSGEGFGCWNRCNKVS